MRLIITLPITPPRATSQSAGRRMRLLDGKPMFFKNKDAQAASRDYTSLLAQQRPATPVEGPIRLFVIFTFPWLKSHTKAFRARGAAYKTTKPDTDNMIKLLKDSLTKLGYWLDDAQVCDERVVKRHSDSGSVHIEIETIGGAK